MRKTILEIGFLLFLVLGLVQSLNHTTPLAAQPLQQVEAKNNIHPIPQIPIVLNGIKMPPSAVSQFNGQPLYGLVNQQAKREGVFYVFTSLEALETFANLNSPPQRVPNCTQEGSFLYEALNFGSYYTGVWIGGQESLAGDSLNNNIESAITTNCNVYTKLYDYTDYSGSQLWLANSGYTPNLGIYGWRNRAGSIRVQ